MLGRPRLQHWDPYVNTAASLPRAPIAIVTGSSQGIGHAIAEYLAGAGFDRLLVDAARDEAAEQAIRDHLQPKRRATFLTADIADIERREPLADALFDAYGAVDCPGCKSVCAAICWMSRRRVLTA